MVPLVAGKGNSFLHVAFAHSAARKKRGWTIQHRPTSNPSKALPDSPGRAARKLAGKKLQLAGLKCFFFRTIHGGSGSEKQDSRARFSFGDPQNKMSAKLDAEKLLFAAELAYKFIVIYLD